MGAKEREMTEAEMSAKANNQQVYGIQMPANKVREIAVGSANAGKIGEKDVETIMWLYGFATDKRLGWKGLAARMKGEVSAATLYGVLTGTYAAADWSGVVKKIEAFMKITIEEEKKLNLGFIETATSRMIFTACDQALNFGMPAFIYGASQLGKTTSLLEYQSRHNHGRTKYIYVGSGWSKARFAREFSKVCRCFSAHASTAELEDRIFDSLGRYNLVIVDEFHHAIETTSDLEAKKIMELVREIYDRTHCGLVLCSTKVGLADIEDGKNRLLFDQLRRRGVVKVVLPDVPKIKDINAIARAFKLELPAGTLLDQIKQLLRGRGLGVFIGYLQDAFRTATAKKEALSWDHFAAVADLYASLACQKNDY